MNYVIDRIEGEYAILYDENKNTKEVKINELYSNVKEGDWIEFDNGNYTFNEELTDKMRKRNSDLLKKLKNKRNK